MTNRYIIEELTSEDLERLDKSHPETGATCKLVEAGYRPMNIGYYATRELAEKSKAEWIARDELQEKINDFVDEMLEEFEGQLEDEEIRTMIKGS